MAPITLGAAESLPLPSSSESMSTPRRERPEFRLRSASFCLRFMMRFSALSEYGTFAKLASFSFPGLPSTLVNPFIQLSLLRSLVGLLVGLAPSLFFPPAMKFTARFRNPMKLLSGVASLSALSASGSPGVSGVSPPELKSKELVGLRGVENFGSRRCSGTEERGLVGLTRPVLLANDEGGCEK